MRLRLCPRAVHDGEEYCNPTRPRLLPPPVTSCPFARSAGGMIVGAYLCTMMFLRIKMPSYLTSNYDDW